MNCIHQTALADAMHTIPKAANWANVFFRTTIFPLTAGIFSLKFPALPKNVLRSFEATRSEWSGAVTAQKWKGKWLKSEIKLSSWNLTMKTVAWCKSYFYISNTLWCADLSPRLYSYLRRSWNNLRQSCTTTTALQWLVLKYANCSVNWYFLLCNTKYFFYFRNS